MIEFFLAFLFFTLIILGMSVGVIFANKPIKGSCGGLNAFGMEGECEICGGNKKVCEEEQKKNIDPVKSEAGFYDAAKKQND